MHKLTTAPIYDDSVFEMWLPDDDTENFMQIICFQIGYDYQNSRWREEKEVLQMHDCICDIKTPNGRFRNMVRISPQLYNDKGEKIWHWLVMETWRAYETKIAAI